MKNLFLVRVEKPFYESFYVFAEDYQNAADKIVLHIQNKERIEDDSVSIINADGSLNLDTVKEKEIKVKYVELITQEIIY